MKLVDILLALLVVVIWGVNFTVIKVGLEELPPLLFSALRFFVVAIPAILLIPFPKTSLWNVLGVGLVLGVVKFGLLFISMNVGISAGLASLLLQGQVIFTIGLSVLIYKERLNLPQVIGLTIAMTGFGFFLGNSSGNTTFLGLVLIISAALAWGCSNIIMKRVGKVNLLHFMVWVSAVPPLPLLFLSYFTETQSPITLITSASLSAWLSIAYVGFISTLLAFALWGRLLSSYPAATVTPFALLIPIVGMLTSGLFLGERLEVSEMFGALLVMCGLIICVFGKRLLVFNRAMQ
jgi:O-acetylserine/cysteine efflux transporter